MGHSMKEVAENRQKNILFYTMSNWEILDFTVPGGNGGS